MNIVLLGGPGSGKGTQARMLVEVLGVPHVASGDLFREHLQGNTALGQKARVYIEQGDLVPDQITVDMVRERLSQPDCQKGVILDGFPRTVSQAEALDKILAEQGRSLDLVAYIKVSNETLLKRLSGRWLCQQCGAIYHMLTDPPRVAGVCDVCGGTLVQREDDRPEVQQRRIEVYWAQTMPLIAYYRERGLLAKIDGEQEVAAVHAQILKAIGDREARRRQQTEEA